MQKAFKTISVVLVIFLSATLLPNNMKIVKAETNTNEIVESINSGNDENLPKKIVREIEEKREENIKYFLMDDFSYEIQH